MPPVLTKAHAALDSAVDKLYRKTVFPDDAARVAVRAVWEEDGGAACGKGKDGI